MSSFRKFNLNVVNGVTSTLEYTFPGVGKTGDTIEVRSMHCEEFRKANAKMSRTIAEMRIANGNQPLSDEQLDELSDEVFASLIASWTFEEDCTVENIVEFIRANPHTREDINAVASNNAFFFKS